MSEDPIGFDGGDENLYRYVAGNPISNGDPYGLWVWPGKITKEANRHPKSDPGGDKWGNAFKHCYASCMMTAENGAGSAFVLGWYLEVSQTIWRKQTNMSLAMDSYNNAKGRESGNKVGSETESCSPSNEGGIPSSKKCEELCSDERLQFIP